MTSLTKSLLGKLRLKARDAEEELISIAKREVQNKAAADDAAKLEDALRVTGKTPDAYEETVTLLHRVKKLKPEAAKLSATSAAYAKAREAIVAYQAETAKLEKARREGQLRLELARNVEYSKYLMANKAKCEIERVECAHPELNGGKAVDLDAFTLTSGNGSNVINCHDETALHREVPASVWQEQAVRRQQIRGAATARAREEYQDKRNAWIEKQSKDDYGQYVADEPFPKFEMPTWSEIVERDWHKTLDGLAA